MADGFWTSFLKDKAGSANEASTVASGKVTLVAGTKAVANASITANSIIRVWRQAAGGTEGHLSVAVSAGTSFTITSSSSIDTSVVFYEIVSY